MRYGLTILFSDIWSSKFSIGANIKDKGMCIAYTTKDTIISTIGSMPHSVVAP
jgi:hypothetical protein